MWQKLKKWFCGLLGIKMTPIILYDNALINSTITASSTEAGYNADYLKDSKTFTAWKGGDPNSNRLIIDLLSAKFIGALAIAGHNLKTVNAKIKIYKSDNGTNFTVVGSEFSVTANGVILKVISTQPGGGGLESLQGNLLVGLGGEILQPLQASQYTARFWKIEFTTTAAPELAVLFFGEYIRFNYPPETPTIPIEEKIVASSEFSNEGHLLGSNVSYHPAEVNSRFKNFPRSWYKTRLKVFWDNHGRWLKPFIWAWDYENRPEDVFLCKLSEQSTMQEPLSMLTNVDEINLSMRILA